MSKTKKLLIALMLLIAVLLLPNMVNAAVEYTRSFPSDNGTIKIHLTGLNLEQDKVYKYALVRQNVAPTDWFSLDDGYTTETATITLSPSEQKIENILKATDTAYIYIKEENDALENSAVSAYQVNLKLPYLQSLQYTKTSTHYDVYTTIYGDIGANYEWYDKVHWQIQKVTDSDFINEFLEDKNNILRLEEYLPNPPTGGGYASEGNPKFENMNDGLYLVWVYRVGTTECKQIYSCIIHDGLPDATTLEEYVGVVNGAPKVESVIGKGDSSNLTTIPGTVNLEFQPIVGDEITINVKFDQDIVKTAAPKLTIKFGAGSNIELTTCEASSNTLTYKYTIKEGDLGALQIVSFTGGDVTNNEGTPAVLTLPQLSGTKVVAVENDESQQEPIDTTTYVSFPFIIYNGKGSVDLKSGVDIENYKMYYQFIEISDEVYNKVTELQEKYKNNEIKYEEYFVQYNEIITKYDDSEWIKTEDGSFERNLTEFTGTKKFALWVKLVMDDKTVYESQIYKMSGSGTATNEPEEQEKPTVTDKDTTKDDTTAKDDLPNTGRVLLFWIIGIITVSGTVSYVRYKKLYM